MTASSLQPPTSSLSARINVADRLAHFATQLPEAIAVACPRRNGFATCSFAELDADATALARGLVDHGVRPGMRLVLLVPPGVEFVKLVFALLRSGATTVLVDPGMGRKHLINCLAAADPDGFVAVSRAQAVRTVMPRRFPRSAINVTVGRRWFWGGATYKQILSGVARPKVRRGAWRNHQRPRPAEDLGRATPGNFSSIDRPATRADDPAAIIFTSGSTGPPKGVLYTHRMFDAQVAEIQRAYDIQPGGVDLACFALFGLFNSAMGVTTVFPEMDFSRPASADPRKLLAAANQWRVAQAFASPTVWDKLSRHCEQTGDRIPTLRKVFSCGAPVPAEVLRRTLACIHANAQMHTPYGATEALPISTIEAREVLNETAAKTAAGAGVCVGRKFDTIDWRVIRITDEPIASIDDAEELPPGEIGELIVRGPQVSLGYLPAPFPRWGGLGRGGEAGTRSTHPSLTLPIEGREPEGSMNPNECAKIPDRDATWHRMGDVGYLDFQGRFWYCGRKSHRVEAASGTLFTECIEALFNQHFWVRRTALVAVELNGKQTPVIVFEPRRDIRTIYPAPGGPTTPMQAIKRVPAELAAIAQQHKATSAIRYFLEMKSFPVDVRHNAKINREQLAVWAATELRIREPTPR